MKVTNIPRTEQNKRLGLTGGDEIIQINRVVLTNASSNQAFHIGKSKSENSEQYFEYVLQSWIIIPSKLYNIIIFKLDYKIAMNVSVVLIKNYKS